MISFINEKICINKALKIDNDDYFTNFNIGILYYIQQKRDKGKP